MLSLCAVSLTMLDAQRTFPPQTNLRTWSRTSSARLGARAFKCLLAESHGAGEVCVAQFATHFVSRMDGIQTRAVVLCCALAVGSG